MDPTAFERRYGFRRDEVTLGNWRTRPYSSWSFQNVGELVPSAVIACADSQVESRLADPGSLLAQSVDFEGRWETVADFLLRSHTDAFVAMKRGEFVADHFAPHMNPGAAHIVFSISKSLTAILAGSLQAEGLLDPAAPVTRYIPEAEGSAYSDASVQHLLDMTVSVDFDEAYLDPAGAFERYRRAMLWNPGGGDEPLLAFLLTLQKGPHPHGGPFRYRSPNSDLLGVILERASGRRYAELMRERLWLPLRAKSAASVTVDGEGTARAAGGVSVTARDLARVGEMMRLGGVLDGRRIVPESWVRDTLTGGSQAAWKAGDFAHLLENGRYRNKWYQTGFDSGAFFAIGIHGQWLYVDPATEVVMVKMSSQPIPVDDPLDRQCVAFFQAVSAML
ncbi:serine hydrolase [Mesorhizobium sp. WSM2239]|uniref:Serine hydrolase n=2 Tax=unclassified Mesorhizobium TaxID=325217 RepID=A0AAU8DG46_9HYPH